MCRFPKAACDLTAMWSQHLESTGFIESIRKMPKWRDPLTEGEKPQDFPKRTYSGSEVARCQRLRSEPNEEVPFPLPPQVQVKNPGSWSTQGRPLPFYLRRIWRAKLVLWSDQFGCPDRHRALAYSGLHSSIKLKPPKHIEMGNSLLSLEYALFRRWVFPFIEDIYLYTYSSVTSWTRAGYWE